MISGGSPPASETSVTLVMATFSVFTFLDFASANSRRVVARHCRCARVTSVIQGVGAVLVDFGQLVLACSVIKSFQVTWLGFFCMHSCVEEFRRENRRLRDYVRSLDWSPFGVVMAPSGASCLDLFRVVLQGEFSRLVSASRFDGRG